MKVNQALLSTEINGLTDAGIFKKIAFHKAGEQFLEELAAKLGLKPGSYDIKSNISGMAASGEITLHADRIFIQLAEFYGRPGVSILYRPCENREDIRNNNSHSTIFVRNLEYSHRRFMENCNEIIKRPEIQKNTEHHQNHRKLS